MPGQLRDRPVLTHVLLPLVAGACAVAIFILDTVTELEIAAAVLYVAVVLMAVSFCQARGVLFITVGCMALTVLSHFLSPGLKSGVTAVANALLSLTAIGVTAFLASKNQSAVIALQRARAELAHVTRMTTLGELTASIAHEVNQPLTGVVSNANACLRWLSAQPPNLEEARLAVERVATVRSVAGQRSHFLPYSRASSCRALPRERVSASYLMRRIANGSTPSAETASRFFE